MLKWFSVLRGRGKAGRFSQLERDLGADPQRKLDDFVAALATSATQSLKEGGRNKVPDSSGAKPVLKSLLHTFGVGVH